VPRIKIRAVTGAAVALLALPAAASAAPTVTASATPNAPQDCQAGCITTIRVACTATDALSAQTTVRCWTRSSYVLSSFQALPAAFVSATYYSPRSFDLCVEGIAKYANGTTASSGVKCSPSDGLGFAVVAG
jgi:hypothetical protein